MRADSGRGGRESPPLTYFYGGNSTAAVAWRVSGYIRWGQEVSFSTGANFVRHRLFLTVLPETSGSYMPSLLRDGHLVDRSLSSQRPDVFNLH
jgi:hypothetical protein